MKKFEVTITETDEGLILSFVDYESKRKSELGKISESTDMGKVCKTVIEQVQLCLAISDLVIPENK